MPALTATSRSYRCAVERRAGALANATLPGCEAARLIEQGLNLSRITARAVGPQPSWWVDECMRWVRCVKSEEWEFGCMRQRCDWFGSVHSHGRRPSGDCSLICDCSTKAFLALARNNEGRPCAGRRGRPGCLLVWARRGGAGGRLRRRRGCINFFLSILARHPRHPRPAKHSCATMATSRGLLAPLIAFLLLLLLTTPASALSASGQRVLVVTSSSGEAAHYSALSSHLEGRGFSVAHRRAQGGDAAQKLTEFDERRFDHIVFLADDVKSGCPRAPALGSSLTYPPARTPARRAVRRPLPSIPRRVQQSWREHPVRLLA